MFNQDVFFNNFNLASLTGVKILNYNITDTPYRSLSVSKLARANKSVLSSAEYAQKTITISGLVGGADWQEQMDNFDMLKAKIQDQEGIIRFEQGTKSVEYTGTLSATSKEFGGPSMGFTLYFLCADPVGQEAGASTFVTETGITTSAKTVDVSVGGSFKALPRITVTVNSVSGSTNKSISILNSGTGKGIKVTRTWAADDVLSIASDLKEVTVNLTNVDYEGTFPEFLPGTRVIQYIDDFSSRNVDITGTYNKRYS